MNRTSIALAACLLAVSAHQAGAQVPPPPALATLPAPAPRAKAPATAPASAEALQEAPEARPRTPEPQVLREVTEDDKIRIEELRVRGQTRKITVQPKVAGMSAYDILPSEPGRDPAQDPKAGQRVWWSLSF
ncbi:MAG TPA: hypothetical protein VLA16_12180 [Ideonella sp.]|nr:hypothetical protein [Ideonella sp.]